MGQALPAFKTVKTMFNHTFFLANEIGDSGASALSNGMRVNKTLTKLYLQGPNKQRTKMDHME